MAYCYNSRHFISILDTSLIMFIYCKASPALVTEILKALLVCLFTICVLSEMQVSTHGPERIKP